MDKRTKFALVFIGSSIVMFLFLYLSNSMIFDADLHNNYVRIHQELTMMEFLGLSENFDLIMAENDYQLERKVSGWLILFICLIGLPAMIAQRSIVSKKQQKDPEAEASTKQED